MAGNTTTFEFAPDLALTAEGQAPEWVHLLPAGRFGARDGRIFDNADPDGLIATFRDRAVDLPIDYEHQNDRPEARLSGPVPAAGWIKELKRKADGIWGRIEWTARARELIVAREYRYLSPALKFLPKSGEIILLKGAALVHSPALHLTALASEENDMTDSAAHAQVDPALTARIAALVGLPADADPKDILTAILDSMGISREALAPEAPDPARFVPVEAVRDLLADRSARMTETRRADASAKVDAALREGHITPGMRHWATALCQQTPRRSTHSSPHRLRPMPISRARYGWVRWTTSAPPRVRRKPN